MTWRGLTRLRSFPALPKSFFPQSPPTPRLRVNSCPQRRSSSRQTSTSSSPLKSIISNESTLMTTPRTLPLPLPFGLSATPTTLSNLCGHASFIMLGSSYITQDILSLRCFAMSGMSLAILFQYYRAIPLIIPIRWNGIFVAINGIMVAYLVSERNEAEKTPPDLLSLYEDQFKKMGFTKIEFYHLCCLNATRVTLDRGTAICAASEVQNKMYFLMDGEVDVKSAGKVVAVVKENAFIGEMSFLNYLADLTSSTAQADCVISSPTASLLVWDFASLETYLQKDRNLRNALQAFISNDLRLKLANMTPRQLRHLETSRVMHRLQSHRTAE